MGDFISFLQPLYPVLIAIFFAALLFGVLSASKILSASTVTNAIIAASFGLLVLLISWNTQKENIVGIFNWLSILLVVLLVLIVLFGMFGIDLKEFLSGFNLKWYLSKERYRTPPTVVGRLANLFGAIIILGFIFWALFQFVGVPLGFFETNPITKLFHIFFQPDVFLTFVIIVSMIVLMWYFIKPEEKSESK